MSLSPAPRESERPLTALTFIVAFAGVLHGRTSRTDHRFQKERRPPTKRAAPRDGKLMTNSSDCRIAQAFDRRALECREAAA
jgi:hypothetical protein